MDEVVQKYWEALQTWGGPIEELRNRFLAEYAEFGEELRQQLLDAEQRYIEESEQKAAAPDNPTTVMPAGGHWLHREDSIQCPHCKRPIRLVSKERVDVHCGSCGSRVSYSTIHLGEEQTPSTIGRFEVQEKIGEGAFGIVYKAIDPELNRAVAVKTLRQGALLKLADRERFLREARAAGRLQHPSIVQVYEVGHENNRPFIVSKLVDGMTLADLLAKQRISHVEAARILIDAAEAVEFANSEGIIHRDLKPSNIFLDQHRRPYIADFGLARQLEGEITMTMEGDILGTPAYMSPEQASGSQKHISNRTDIYSLGVILYRMICGELPFHGNQRMLLLKVMRDDPPAPRRIDDSIPIDLETIALKAMSKEPHRRYASAAEFANDLRRWRNSEPIHARRIGSIAKLYRWRRRHPKIANLLFTVAALLVLIATMGMVWGIRERGHAKESARQNQIAQELATESERRLRSISLGRGLQELEAGYSDTALFWFAQSVSDHAELSKAERIRLEMTRRSLPLLTDLIPVSDAQLTMLHVGALGQTVVAADAEGQLTQHNLVTATSRTLQLPKGGTAYQFSVDDENRKAVAAVGREVSVIIDMADWKILREFRPPDLLGAPVISGDGQTIATAALDGVVHLWDSETGTVTSQLDHEAGFLNHIRFLPSGRLLTISYSRMDKASQLFVWDIQKEEPDLKSTVLPGAIRALTVTTEEDKAFVGIDSGALHSWDLATGKSELIVGESATITRIISQPQHLVVIRNDRSITLFDESGQQKIRREFPSGIINHHVSKDGRLLAVLGKGGTVGVFALKTLDQLTPWFGKSSFAREVNFLPDSHHLLTTGDGCVVIWDLASLAPDTELMQLKGEAVSAEFSPNGQYIAATSNQGDIRIWDAETGAPKMQSKASSHQPSTVNVATSAFDKNSRLFLTGNSEGVAVLRDTNGAVVGEPVQADGFVFKVAFSPTSDQFMIGTNTGDIKFMQVGNGTPLFEFSRNASTRCLKFSGDGQQIAIADNRGSVTVHDLGGRLLHGEFAHPTGITSVNFSADNTKIATTSEDRFLRIWDLKNSDEATTVLEYPERPVCARFISPDHLLTAATAGTVDLHGRHGRVWRYQDDRQRLSDCLTSNDGSVVVVCGGTSYQGLGSGIVFLLDAATGQRLGPVLRQAGYVHHVDIHPHENRLLIKSDRNSVVLQSFATDDRPVDTIRRHAALVLGRSDDLLDSQRLTSAERFSLMNSLRESYPQLFATSANQVRRFQEYVDSLVLP